MGSLVRFGIFATMMVVLLIFVVVPVAGGLLFDSIAHDAGLTGNGVRVSVNLLGAGILSGRAESVTVNGDNVTVPHGVVGHMDLTLGDVSLSNHSFSTVSGRLTDVTINAPGGPVVLETIDLDGPAAHTLARGTLVAAEATRLVKQVASSAGVSVDSLQLTDGGLRLVSGGNQIDAALRIAGRALVLDRPGAASTVLFSPAPSDPWQVQSVSVSPSGIQLALSIDATRLAESMGAGANPAR